ncbi:glyoxalase/bleomycin resistance/dioxygenase family protein [Paenibacillus sp. 5J-6]|uniref:Glyoxalase/bleomycin resistance/dioxygenase family protein n=1 Tax=Paenibacillus silvestris TaxID=2606219 RepID=A0A6L8URJ3_9BACL|nr:glyoxalase/bleomycin resistance/dioxygenase family protein [Paenibacillus silvestris]MZQ80547.1 glyoxalase/bleomycin resistance/dioxygenase family protein [Paenibacillus silvestris]
MQFPIIFETKDEICFQPIENFKISFKEAMEPIAAAHFAFEVPLSEFENVVNLLKSKGIQLLKWSDGRYIDNFETGKNVYFRDGDGNLLEIITHHYVKEGILSPAGDFKLLYLREIGFPADSVKEFREFFVDIFELRLDKVRDDFTFAIGGTSHMVIPSKKRKWIPIEMVALPPTMNVIFGVSSTDFVSKVSKKLTEKGVPFLRRDGHLHFNFKEYNISLKVTSFNPEIPALLNLP